MESRQDDAHPGPAGSAAARLRHWLLVGLAFVAALAASAFGVWQIENERLDAHQAQVSDLASDLAADLARTIETALSSSYALAAMVRGAGGRFDSFDVVAEQMLGLYPGTAALALAPEGVVRQIVPLRGNEGAIGHDLIRDPRRNKEALLARDSGRLTLAGPFPLVQGGVGAAGRFPVFLEQPDGAPRFWGLVAVVLRFPEVLAPTGLGGLDARGYEFALWRVHPDTGARQIIAGTEAAFGELAVQRPVAVPNAAWTLTLRPRAGGANWAEIGFLSLLALTASAGVAAFAGFVAGLAGRKRLLEQTVAQRTAELRRAMSNLRDTEHAMSDAGIGIFWVDEPGGAVVLSNRGLRELLGRTEQETGELNVLDFDPSGLAGTLAVAGPDAATATAPAAPAGREASAPLGRALVRRLETTFVGGRGVAVPVEVLVYRMAAHGGEPARLICFAVDITQRRQAVQALREAKEAAERASRARSSFLSNTRHELMTPLNGILGLATLMQRRTSDPALLRQLGMVELSGRRLFELLSQVLELAALEAGELRVEAQAFSPDELVTAWERVYRPRADDKGLALRLMLDTPSPAPRCVGDPRHLERIGSILLDNAVKFTAQGEVELVLRIEAAADAAAPTLLLSVSDTGVGLSEAEAARLFKAFEQADAASTRVHAGAGIGLAIAWRRAQLLGGGLVFSSRPGGGSVFRLAVPLHP